MSSRPGLPAGDLISSLPPELCHQVARHLATYSDILSVARTSRRNRHAFNHVAYERAAVSLPLACLLVHWAAARGFTRVIEAAYHARIDVDGSPGVPYPAVTRRWDTPPLMILDEATLASRTEYILGVTMRGTPLHAAAAAGRLDVVQQLLGYGADPSSGSLKVCSCDGGENNGLGEWGTHHQGIRHLYNSSWTPTHIALCTGQTEMAMFLLSRHPTVPMSADVEKTSTPLHAACKSGHLELVQWLHTSGRIADIDARDWKDQTALMYAYHYGHRTCFRYLLSLGAGINEAVRRPREWSWGGGEVDVTILLNAIAKNRLQDALELLDLPHLHYEGEEAVRFLAVHPRPTWEWSFRHSSRVARQQDPVALLVRKVLDRVTADWTRDQRRVKLDEYLGLAAMHCNWRAVQALLQSGADVNSTAFADVGARQPSRKETPLYQAITHIFVHGQGGRLLPTVKCLLEGGADPELRVGDQQLPALWFLFTRHPQPGGLPNPTKEEVAMVLIQHGAPPQRRSGAEFNSPDRFSVAVSPLEHLVWGGHMEDFELALEACGGPQTLSDEDIVGLWRSSRAGSAMPGLRLARFERILELDEDGVIARRDLDAVKALLGEHRILTEAVRKLLRRGAAVELYPHELTGAIRKGLESNLLRDVLAGMPGGGRGSRSHRVRWVTLQKCLSSPWWRSIHDKVGIVCAFLDHGLSVYEGPPVDHVPSECPNATLLAQAILTRDCHPMVDAMLQRQPLRDRLDEDALDYIQTSIDMADPHLLGRLLTSMQDPESVLRPIREQLCLNLLHQHARDAGARERIRTVGDALRIVACLELLFRFGGQPDLAITTTTSQANDSSTKRSTSFMLGKTLVELTDLPGCSRLDSWKMGITWIFHVMVTWSDQGEVLFQGSLSVDAYHDCSIHMTDLLWDLPWVIQETGQDVWSGLFNGGDAGHPVAVR